MTINHTKDDKPLAQVKEISITDSPALYCQMIWRADHLRPYQRDALETIKSWPDGKLTLKLPQGAGKNLINKGDDQ